MRSFFCYVRTLYNQFFSCVVVAAQSIETLPSLAFAKFTEQGITLKANDIDRMRFVAEPRNLDDGAGYPPVDEPDAPNPDDYCVISEYTPGETPTH